MADPIYYDYDTLRNEKLHAERLTNTSGEDIPPYYRKLIDVIQYYSSNPENFNNLNPQYRDLVLNNFAYLIEHIDVPFVELSPRFIQLLEPYLFVHDPSEDDFQDLGDLLNYHRRLIRVIPMMGDKELYLKGLFNFILSYSQLLKCDETILHLLIIAFLEQDICLPSIQNFLSTYFPDEYRSFSDPDVFLSRTRTRDTQRIIIKFYMNHIPMLAQLPIEYQETLIVQNILISGPHYTYYHTLPYEEFSYILNLILPLHPLHHKDDFNLRLSYVLISLLPETSNSMRIRIILNRIYDFLIGHETIWKGEESYTSLLDLYLSIIRENIHLYPELHKIYEGLQGAYGNLYTPSSNKRPLAEEFEEETSRFKRLKEEIYTRLNPHKRYHEEEEEETRRFKRLKEEIYTRLNPHKRYHEEEEEEEGCTLEVPKRRRVQARRNPLKRCHEE